MLRLITEFGRLLHAGQFLTRLPLPDRVPWDDGALARAARYFSLIGALIGAIAGAVWWAALWLGLPPLAAAGLALAAQVAVTGGLHEDGLADTADSIGAGSSRERALEIMRDSRIGTYGALALGLSLLIRAAGLAALSPGTGVAALIVALAVGRAAMVPTQVLLSYARPEGMASGVAGTTAFEAGTGAAIALALAVLLTGPLGAILALGVALAVWTPVTLHLRARLGGYTGDTLGATEQMVEIAVLLALVGLWA